MVNFGLQSAILTLLFTVAATYDDVIKDSLILKQDDGQPRSQERWVHSKKKYILDTLLKIKYNNKIFKKSKTSHDYLKNVFRVLVNLQLKSNDNFYRKDKIISIWLTKVARLDDEIKRQYGASYYKPDLKKSNRVRYFCTTHTYISFRKIKSIDIFHL